MLFGPYIGFFAAFLTTLLVSDQIPIVINSIDRGPIEATQLLSALSEFANGAKESIVEALTRPSDFFHVNENDQSPSVPDALPPPPPASPPESPLDSPSEPPLESSPGSIQPPEPTPFAVSKSPFCRVDGSRIILEFDLEKVPGFDATRKVVARASYWYGVLFWGGSGAGWVGELYWLRALLPAALGFFGGLGYGFAGRCWWCLSRRKGPRAVKEKAEQVVVPGQTERRAQANAYCECFLCVFQRSEFRFVDRVR